MLVQGLSFVLERGDSLLICGHNGVSDPIPYDVFGWEYALLDF